MAETDSVRSRQYGGRLRGHRTHRVLLAGLVGIVAIVGGTLSLHFVRASDTRTSDDVPGILPPLPLGQPVISAIIQLDPGVTDIATGYGAVWASTPMAVNKIDPLTNEVAATIPVEGIGDSGKLAVGEGAVWITHDVNVVSRIDPLTNKVIATIDVGPGVRGIAVGGGRVWVTREPQPNEINGYLVQIDPATNSVVGDPATVGVGPGPVAYGAGAVWVTLTSDTGALVKIDPVTMAKVGEIDGVRGAAAYVAGEVWAATDQSVLEIDPSTSTIVNQDAIPGPWEVEFGSGAAWVLTETGSTSSEIYLPDPQQPSTVVEVNPGSGESVGAPVPVGNLPLFMSVGEGAVWVAQYDSGTITRIDPQR